VGFGSAVSQPQVIFDGSPGRGSPVFSAKSTASRASD
jgi:hypothetical protein